MSSLIFIILMVWFIMRVVKNKQNDTGKNDSSASRSGSSAFGSSSSASSSGNSTFGTGSSQRSGSTYSASGSGAKKSAYESAMAFKKAASDAGSGSSTFGSGSGSASGSISTTEYLEQKAKEDARDHAKEKRAEQARLHQETGGRMVGMRYYEWDSIPKGKRVVRCSYCGAENLISERYKPNRYTCYFCREILE